MRLNLGCGTDIRPGFVNVDSRVLPGVDLIANLEMMPWPFKDDSADEILMLDFLEHFPYGRTNRILLECHRVLRMGGRMTVQVPDGLHTARALIQEGDYLCNRCGARMNDYTTWFTKCPGCGQTADEISEAAVGRLYGGQDYPGNFHQTVFTARSLTKHAQDAGFKPIQVDEAGDYDWKDHYWRNWTISMTFEKVDFW